MAIKTLFDRLCRTTREWRAANGANVTVTFALATIPMVGFVGAAVDYSHANSVKAAMQAAADSTALMLSKNASSLGTSALQTKANDYFNALFTRKETTAVTVSATYNASTGSGSQVIVNASSNVKANFMGLLGVSTMKVAVDSQVKWGNTKLRVALALDNTGSMSDDGKIQALKTATNSLLTQLKGAAAKDGDVYVSIVPFSKDVNIGKSNYKATWIDWTDWNSNNGSCSRSGSGTDTSTGCLLKLGIWTPANHSTWNGCVADRGLPLLPSILNTDINVLGIDLLNLATVYPAEQSSSCPQAVSNLGYDWTGMTTMVNKMSPGGNTNQVIGLQHAWMSLSGGGPYPAPPPEDPNYKYSKVIILLTDGLNTQNRWYSSQSSIDARQKLACDNIKAAGITLYTVQVNTGGDPLQNTLKNCASTADKFFLLTSASQMVSTFNSIGTALSNLRIAQ